MVGQEARLKRDELNPQRVVVRVGPVDERHEVRAHTHAHGRAAEAAKSAAAAASAKPQAEAKEQTITLGQMVTNSKVRGEALKIRQALRNLIGNAIKYTPNGGKVTLSSDENEAGIVNIHIQDTGYGIPATDLPHLFKRFYRVRNNGHDDIEGNGLGLAIVKSIAVGHGGDVTVESDPGKGTCFTFSLPLLDEQ